MRPTSLLLLMAVALHAFAEDAAKEATTDAAKAEVDAKQAGAACMGFRKSTWGMTPDEVVAQEGNEHILEKNAGLVVYETNLAGMKTAALFSFDKGKLTSGIYKSLETHATAEQYMNDFGKLKSLLAEKYGPPKVDTVNYLSKSAERLQVEPATALNLGQAQLNAVWAFPHTELMLILSKKDLEFDLIVLYRQVEGQEQRAADEKQKALKDL